MAPSTRSPIDDLTYDLLTILQNKARGLEAYDAYLRDAADDEELSDLFRTLRSQDEENVAVLKEALAIRLADDLGLDDDDDVGEEIEDAALLEGDADIDEEAADDDPDTIEEDDPSVVLTRTDSPARAAVHARAASEATSPSSVAHGGADGGERAQRR